MSQIPRSRNTHADSLATLATFSLQSLPRVILIEDLCKPTEVEKNMVHVHQIRAMSSWTDSIVLFLKEDILPKSKFEANKVRRKATQFSLYKRSFSSLYLLGIHPEAVKLFLEKLHEGIYGSHTRADLCLTGPSLKDISGQRCRGKHKSM